jgi:small conductance mechanosensitive channel
MLSGLAGSWRKETTAMDIHAVLQSAIPLLTVLALKVVGAIILWIIGRQLINLARRLVVRSLKYPFDQTVATYIGTAVSVILNIALIIAILGFFGIETTSFAALLAGVGIAVGAAWSGLLANLAAGVFLLILRPFKVGDFISAGGILGTVDEIGLFVTNLTTLDNVRTYVATPRSSVTTFRTSRPIPIAAWISSPSSTTA